MSRYSKIAALAIALTTAGTAAYAANSGNENDVFAVTKAQIPLSQAVTTAEQHVGGKAARADYESTRQGRAYDVEVVSGRKVFDVRVDATNGSVIASTEDKADRDNEDHEDHGNDDQEAQG